MDSSPAPEPSHRRLRRLGLGLLTVVVALGGFVLVLLFFEGRDDSQVPQSASRDAPGRLVSDQRRAQAPAAVRRDQGQLSEDQLLHALELGDVVLLYGTPTPPAPLRALQEQVSGPFDPVLAANGAAVILAYRPGTDGVVALAWRRVLRARSAADPALKEFANYWLGRGRG